MIEKICCMRCNKYRKLKNPKKSNILDKTLVFSIICLKMAVLMKKYFNKKNQLRY